MTDERSQFEAHYFRLQEKQYLWSRWAAKEFAWEAWQAARAAPAQPKP
jgi:hypothetical protein